MPVDAKISGETWLRFDYLRQSGHRKYLDLARKCEDFFAGQQWDERDLALLKASRRPALTINQILRTVSNVMGEQIFNRTDIAFRPRNEGATSEIADALTKVFMQISDNNQLAWLRSDMFADGIITGRGYLDMRLDFTDSLQGEIRFSPLNPRNVLPDADADQLDPDTWSDVVVTKWLSPDEIELLYSKKDADLLRGKMDGGFYSPYSVDAFDERERFGGMDDKVRAWTADPGYDQRRTIRVIERQHKKLDKIEHFVNLKTGDMRPIPSSWTPEQITQHLAQNPDMTVTKKLVHRIRWTVVADNVVLHDDWSPYKHFSVIPYFPYFRRGRTIGLVENLIGPQEMLNKVSSQELHVVNTTANSGWKVKTGTLRNMTIAELENRGSQTGLVVEVDDLDGIDKIQPNQVPSGLDRISYKAEEHIKTISGVSDYQTGFAREDVSAKSVQANKASGSTNTAKVMDNLNRTDFFIARNVLDCIQEFYSEERLVVITTDRLANTTESIRVNQPTPEGAFLNDLTVGEYAVVVTNQPERDTFEDSQFDQALALRMDAGVQIPDRFLIQSSKLRDKAAIVQALEGDQESPEAQEAKQLERRMKLAEVETMEGDAANKKADAGLKVAKTQREAAEAQNAGEGDAAELQKIQLEHQRKMEEMQMEFAFKKQEMEFEFALKKRESELNMQLKQQETAANIENQRAMAAVQANALQQSTKAKNDSVAKTTEAKTQAMATKPAAKKPTTGAKK